MLGVSSFGFGSWWFGFRVQGFGFRVLGFGPGASDFKIRVSGLGEIAKDKQLPGFCTEEGSNVRLIDFCITQL